MPADDLTNLRFDQFDRALRSPVTWGDIDLPMIDLLMKFTESFKKRRFQEQANPSKSTPKFQKSSWG